MLEINLVKDDAFSTCHTLSVRYPYLLFDADNTLFDFDRAQAEALKKAMLELHGHFEPDYLELYDEVNQRFWQAFERGEIDQTTVKEKRFEAFAEALGASFDPHDMNSLYLQGLLQGSHLLDGALELIQKLAVNHNLAIITNGLKELQRPRFTASPIIQYFEGIVVSDELGIAKPHPGIFDAAFKLLGHPAKEHVLMIGDSLSSDMQGGVNYGIDTCWFNPAGKANKPGLPITHEVKDFSGLGKILL